MPSVEATKPPVCTLPVLPMAMPLGLTRKTWPFAVRLPRIWEASCPVTRFSATEDAPG